MPMPHRTFKQVIKRRLVGKEGSERVRELRAILTELPNYKSGPYADLRKWVEGQLEETRVRSRVVHRDSIAVRREGAAQVAFVGPPNAGKSTLLSRITAARPKVASYPFTTLSPNLGMAGEDERFVVADVPGLIEGAHEGKGLGLTFLRHVSRCRVLVYVVDLTGDPGRDAEAVRVEVAAFDPALAERRRLVVGTKLDLLEPRPSEPPAGVDLMVSGLTGEGVEDLETRLAEEVQRARAEESPRTSHVVVRPGREPFVVKREGDRYRVAGPRVERWVAEVDMDDERQVAQLQRRLVRAGVERRLAEAGARRGDEVVIGGVAFEYIPESDAGDDAPG
jgi:GTP-binding protein